jgi:hypothetical protein
MDEVVAKNAFVIYDEAVAPARRKSAWYPVALAESAERITQQNEPFWPDNSLPWSPKERGFGHYSKEDSLLSLEGGCVIFQHRALAGTDRRQETERDAEPPETCAVKIGEGAVHESRSSNLGSMFIHFHVETSHWISGANTKPKATASWPWALESCRLRAALESNFVKANLLQWSLLAVVHPSV